MGNLSGLFVNNDILMIVLGFAVLILLMMICQHIGEQKTKEHARKCPFCAEIIATEAKICKHCRSELVT